MMTQQDLHDALLELCQAMELKNVIEHSSPERVGSLIHTVAVNSSRRLMKQLFAFGVSQDEIHQAFDVYMHARGAAQKAK